jgi:outer membrane receptor protein involved in Fe transport
MKTALFALPALLAGALPAMADEADSTGIIVTAARGTALKDMDVSASVLSARDVQTAPAISTDQIINHIPGIFTLNQPAAALHPTGDTFSIRGFGTTTNVNTLVMLDGLPMNDPYFRVVDWNQVAKGQIESIEVIRGGGATSLWGNMAMGGIVNIVSKTPQAGHMDLDLSAGSYRTYSATANAGIGIAPGVVAGITASDTTSDGYNKTPAAYRNPYMTATSSRNLNLGGSLHADLAPDAKVFVSALWHSLRESGLVWQGTSNRWDTFRLSFGGEKGVGPGKLSLSGWYGTGAMDTTNVSQTPSFSIFTPTAGVPYVSQTEHATYSNLGGSLVWQASPPDCCGMLHDIKLGVDGRTITANDPVNFFGTSGATGNLLSHARHQFEGVFAQASLVPGDGPLSITLGLRGDFWQTANGSLNGFYQGSAVAQNIANQSYARFDPRLGAKLKLGALSLRAAGYSNFAAPGMNQMYRSFIGGSSYTTVNPNLKPQTNLGAEAGFDLDGSAVLAGLTLSATAYTNKLKNFIDYATVQSGCSAANTYCGTGIAGINGGSVSQYVNAGDAVLRGFEVLGSWSQGPLSLTGGFTYTDAHLTFSRYTTASAGVIPDPVNQQLGQVPEWTANASAQLRITHRFSLNATVKSFPSYWNSTSHNQRNDGATILDMGASWQVMKGLELYASAQNLTNVRYLDQGYGVTTTNGSTVRGSTIPALGIPLWATFGLRAHI